MTDSNQSSTMDLSFLSDETHFQQLEPLRKLEVPKAEKRKRGRPRIRPIVPVQLDADGNPVKKPRGRPKKNLANEVEVRRTTAAGVKLKTEETGKKKRGRPRKSSMDPTGIVLKSDSKKPECTIQESQEFKEMLPSNLTEAAKNQHLIQPKRFEKKKSPEVMVAASLDPSLDPSTNQNAIAPDYGLLSPVIKDLSPDQTDIPTVAETALMQQEPSNVEPSLTQTNPRRKRGRPKKIRDPNDSEPKVKRPRGRPPKSKTTDGSNGSSSIMEKLRETPATANNFSSGNSNPEHLENSSKKKIKLARTGTQKTLNDSKTSQLEDTSMTKGHEENKDVVLNFKKNQEKITKPNTILDDSYDVFSFDNNGTSNFVIPDDAIPAHSNKKFARHVSSPMKPLKERLEQIDTNVIFSDDSQSDDDVEYRRDIRSRNSSPIASPSISNSSSSLRQPTSPLNQNGVKETPALNKDLKTERNQEFLKEVLIPDEATPKDRMSQTWSLAINFEDVKGQGTPDNSIDHSSVSQSNPAPPSSPQYASEKTNLNISNGGAISPFISIPKNANDSVNLIHRQSSEAKDSITSAQKEVQTSSPSDHVTLKLNKDLLTLNEYFSDLLSYMNQSDACLSEDRTGELTFFVNQMPKDELLLTFHQWIALKGNEVYESFEADIQKKILALKYQYNSSTEMIKRIEDDDVLIKIAKKLNIDV